MLKDQSREEWRTRAHAVPISEALRFVPEGLVLGAGTVLIAADGVRRLKNPKGQEARVLALLSAAYGKALVPSVLGNIERATKAWNEGDDCLAYMHLVHARLGELQHPREAAQRLASADAFLKAGGRPRTIFEALQVNRSYIDAVEKDYNPSEPRVPAGSGKPSGEWTSGGGAAVGEQAGDTASSGHSLLGYLAPGAPSWLGEIAPAAATSLGEFAATVVAGAAGAAAAFGIIFIPSPNSVRVEGDVEGVPGLHYSWNRDEAQLHLTYDDPDGGQRTFSAYIDGDVFRDQQGNVIGRVIGGDMVAIDAAAVSSDLVKQDEPKLCPAYAPDVAGSDQGKPYEENRAAQYEDYVKRFINPDGPTPSGYVYYLPNPEQNGEPVSYDDCQQKTGTVFEIKGETYAKLLQSPIVEASVKEGFLDQALDQVQASGGRPIIWVFAEQEAATYAWNLFQNDDRLKGFMLCGCHG